MGGAKKHVLQVIYIGNVVGGNGKEGKTRRASKETNLTFFVRSRSVSLDGFGCEEVEGASFSQRTVCRLHGILVSAGISRVRPKTRGRELSDDVIGAL